MDAYTNSIPLLLAAEARLPRLAPPLSLHERVRGCLLGGAVGDALGAPVEFASLAHIQAVFGPQGLTQMVPAYGRLGAVTDDTQLTLWTTEGLIRAWVRGSLRGVVSYEGCVAHAYLRWLRTQGEPTHPDVALGEDGWLWSVRDLWNARAPGSTCLYALGAIRRLGEAADNPSKGCGAVTRVAPVGFLPRGHQAFDMACRIGRLTHGHPSGWLPAGWLAQLIAGLAQGGDLAAAIAQADAALMGQAGSDETVQALAKARALAAQGRQESVPAALGQGWLGHEALAIALWCVLVGRDFRDALVLAVNHDGDSDSTASLAGQILGALQGAGAIPGEWLGPLELRAEIERLAADFSAVCGDPQPDPEAVWAAGYPGS
jgi:ADP-ribosylglycohydrolase